MSCTIYEEMFHCVVYETLFTVGQIGHVYSPVRSHNALGCQLFLSFTLRLCPLPMSPSWQLRPLLGWEGRQGEGDVFSRNPYYSRLFCLLKVALVCSIKSSSNVILSSVSTGFGQRPCPPVHLGPEDTPAVFGIRRGEDLPEQEGRAGSEEAAGREEEAGPADPGAHRQPERGLRAQGQVPSWRCGRRTPHSGVICSDLLNSPK